MGDIDLLRKFQEIDNKTNKSKLVLLEDLKSRIETEIFISNLQYNGSPEGNGKSWRLETDLENVKTAIFDGGDNKITADLMLKINEINKRYKRRK